MSRHWVQSMDDRDRTIRELKEQLWMARYALLARLPADLHRLLTSYDECKTSRESMDWLDRIAVVIVEMAQPLSETLHGWNQPRGMCPLCGEGSNSYYEQGFALPEGLRRHLVGYGKTGQCVFTDTARKLALDDWRGRFQEADEKERLEEESRLQQRLLTETTYRINPFERAKLADEGISFGGACTPEQMAGAEQRLIGLGLRKLTEDKIVSWIDERAEWIVYADPRQFGRIDFVVWKRPLPKRAPSSVYKYRIGSFHLLDFWKNDLKKKYESRLPSGVAIASGKAG